MSVDSDDLVVPFDDVVIGKSYVQDLTVWNKAEIALRCNITTSSSGSDVIKLSLPETGEEVQELSMPGLANKLLRLTFKPDRAGEFRSSVYLNNMLNSNNKIELSVHATVAEEEQVTILAVETQVDFGDCYTGEMYPQVLGMRNVAEFPIDLDLEVPEVHGLTFHVHTPMRKRTISEQNAAENQVQVNGRKDLELESMCNQLHLQPGKTRMIQLRYSPRYDPYSHGKRHEMTRHVFYARIRVSDHTGQLLETRSILMRAQICTSEIELTQSKVHFGDLLVGVKSQKSFKVRSGLAVSVPAHTR